MIMQRSKPPSRNAYQAITSVDNERSGDLHQEPTIDKLAPFCPARTVGIEEFEWFYFYDEPKLPIIIHIPIHVFLYF
jgi:hypothetical protein